MIDSEGYAYAKYLASNALVIQLSPKLGDFLSTVVSDLLCEVLNDSLTFTNYRVSFVPTIEDARNAIGAFRSKVAHVDLLADDVMEINDDDDDDDDAYSSSDDSSNEEDCASTQSDFDSESEIDEDEENVSEEEDEQDIDLMYTDKENMTPLADIFNLEQLKTSEAFKNFFTYVLETRLKSGMEFSDTVMSVFENFVQQQVTLSFQLNPDSVLSRCGVPPLGLLNELFLVTEDEGVAEQQQAAETLEQDQAVASTVDEEDGGEFERGQHQTHPVRNTADNCLVWFPTAVNSRSDSPGPPFIAGHSNSSMKTPLATYSSDLVGRDSARSFNSVNTAPYGAWSAIARRTEDSQLSLNRSRIRFLEAQLRAEKERSAVLQTQVTQTRSLVKQLGEIFGADGEGGNEGAEECLQLPRNKDNTDVAAKRKSVGLSERSLPSLAQQRQSVGKSSAAVESIYTLSSTPSAAAHSRLKRGRDDSGTEDDEDEKGEDLLGVGSSMSWGHKRSKAEQ